MRFNVLAFKFHPAFVRTRHWIALAYRPVVAAYIFVRRFMIIAVFATERPLRAKLSLVSRHIATL